MQPGLFAYNEIPTIAVAIDCWLRARHELTRPFFMVCHRVALTRFPACLPMNHIRNFSIIAHIDHGKSTLADRIISRCGGLSDREMSEQVLDSMDIEKERGITIKAQTAALHYKARDGQVYNLNLIDTPGHVDFSYEVSPFALGCEGALLVVDASQGVEAQTVANCYTALDLGVEVVPVLNKMDLPNADPDNAKAEIEDVIGIDATDAIVPAQPRPAWAWKTSSKPWSHASPHPKATPTPAARDDRRQLVRQLRGRGDAGACGGQVTCARASASR